MSTLKLIPQTPEMAPFLSGMSLDCFWHDPWKPMMVPFPKDEARQKMIDLSADSLAKAKAKESSEGAAKPATGTESIVHKFVVIDTSVPSPHPELSPEGAIIAQGSWKLKVAGERTFAPVEQMEVPGTNTVEMLRYFFAPIDEMRNRLVGDKTVWQLTFLATAPEHHRKGAGRLIIEWGVQKADEDGLECYLSSSAMAKPLYERYGFKEVYVAKLDMTPFGKQIVTTSTAMIRPKKGER